MTAVSQHRRPGGAPTPSPAIETTFGARRSRSEGQRRAQRRSEEHTSELQSRQYLVCRLLLEKKKNLKSSSRRSARGRKSESSHSSASVCGCTPKVRASGRRVSAKQQRQVSTTTTWLTRAQC